MKAVLFDIDGTLIDSVDFHAEAWVRALAHFDIPVPFAEMRPLIGMGGDQLLPLFVSHDTPSARRREIQTYRADLFKREYLPLIRPFPGTRPLFERCRAAGLTVALASSGSAEEVETYAGIADVADLVDATTSASDVAHSKPSPDIFAAALAKCAPATAADAIVVGDTRFDMEAALRAGLRGIGMLCGGVDGAELTRAGAVAIFRDPADLLARFADSPLSR